jgi:3-deoxy-D-manno-octulosonic-acid transferase
LGLDLRRPIIVAGSTGPGEEQLLIDTCPPEAQLVIAPRKPERFEEVARLAPGMVRRTQRPDQDAGVQRPDSGAPRHMPNAKCQVPNANREGQAPAEPQLFLLDTLGELRKAYALADVVIVGRSFLGLYGSDLMEPAALGKPVIIGPHHDDFADTVQAMTQADAVIITGEPGKAAAQLLADRKRAAQLGDNARKCIEARQGSTARHAAMLRKLLEDAGQSQ